MAAADHLRIHLRGFLPLDLCKELSFIHRSCSTVGYRPNVFSTTLAHLAATNCAHLILPFVTVRERLKEKAEEFFGCEFELFVEFTGLISWCRGASIGWHSDDNRPYLQQRDFAAVCYLNNHGKDFKGGVFHFKDGEPASIAPVAGDVLMYTADDRNIHAVDEVLDGERLTLTLWFTRNGTHDEDAKLTHVLSQILAEHVRGKPYSFLPLSAPDSMYWFSDGHFGFDVRCARVQNLGFKFCKSKHQESSSFDLANGPLELLGRPVRLGRGDKIFDREFINSLHGLQVVQFYHLKASEFLASGKHSEPYTLDNEMNGMELVLPCDHQFAGRVLGDFHDDDDGDDDDGDGIWGHLALAVSRWEEHMGSLSKELLMLIPQWVTHQTVFRPPTHEKLLGSDRAPSGTQSEGATCAIQLGPGTRGAL
ncbi:hypothetical protein AXF42_Ash013070 [Apostasia shenzhenica]|uniref:procollagen-proline 3-dioxygenase n=1 Tax=Apostasia shenzhenica TaxID=1088818 RepID=A0A2I0BD23_9ASPA|nr:hypothetical protein AXF42_Ash013070 [Apostasia shenzhenica]